MIQKKFEITLPDETQLIAEAVEGSNCPCINIYQRLRKLLGLNFQKRKENKNGKL